LRDGTFHMKGIIIFKLEQFNYKLFIHRGIGIEWYTDGSKTESGSGPRVYYHTILGRHTRHTSVFQAEVYVLLICAEINIKRGYKGKPITKFGDQIALLSGLTDKVKDPNAIWRAFIHSLTTLNKKCEQVDSILSG